LDDYTRKYGAVSSSKPECYGDIDVYDDADRVCNECEVRRSCKVIVDKKLKREVDEARADRLRYDRPTSPVGAVRNPAAPNVPPSTRAPVSEPMRPLNNRREVDLSDPDAPGIEDSWWGALAYNSFLSSSKAVLNEAYHGLNSIPYVKYPNPFKRRDK
jgi:hypothetical protein